MLKSECMVPRKVAAKDVCEELTTVVQSGWEDNAKMMRRKRKTDVGDFLLGRKLVIAKIEASLKSLFQIENVLEKAKLG